ncbi:hypothetical protein pb186bvf_018975 [Paramecium bursaria]
MKHRYKTMDKIQQKVQKVFEQVDNKLLSRILRMQDQNKEQDKNGQNFTGCIVSKQQLKKKVEEEIVQFDSPVKEIIQDKIMTQASPPQDCFKRKKQLITADVTLRPQIQKLQLEKQSIENEINNIDEKIETMRYQKKQKCDTVGKRNWREEKKNFEQTWSNLESQGILYFQERLQTVVEDPPSSDRRRIDKEALDQLSNEIETLLQMRLQEELQEQQDLESQRRIYSTYQAPMQVIEEEQSIDMSFQA